MATDRPTRPPLSGPPALGTRLWRSSSRRGCFGRARWCRRHRPGGPATGSRRRRLACASSSRPEILLGAYGFDREMNPPPLRHRVVAAGGDDAAPSWGFTPHRLPRRCARSAGTFAQALAQPGVIAVPDGNVRPEAPFPAIKVESMEGRWYWTCVSVSILCCRIFGLELTDYSDCGARRPFRCEARRYLSS